MSEARRILTELGVRPRRSLGQHFLVDENVIARCTEYAGIKKGEKVLEIGPGIGFLTEKLLGTGASLTVIESDRRFCDYLGNRFGDALTIVMGDATRVDLPPFDKVVSNLPYNISSEITFRLLERKFKLAVLMYQKEFAERLVAGEGSAIYGRLSVMADYKAESEILESVSRRSFWPEPQVDSAVVRFRVRPPRFDVEDERLFVDIVRILFSHRRKKIYNALISESKFLGISKERLREIASDIPYSEERVEMLTPQEIGEIADYFCGIREERSP